MTCGSYPVWGHELWNQTNLGSDPSSDTGYTCGLGLVVSPLWGPYPRKRMAGTPTSHAYCGSDLRVMIGSAWRRQRRDECSKTSLVGGEQTNNSHTLHTVLQTHSSFVGVGSVSLPGWHPHSSPEDDAPLLIPQGALAPARSVIINWGEARGHRSEGSRRAPPCAPWWLLTYVSEEEGPSW